MTTAPKAPEAPKAPKSGSTNTETQFWTNIEAIKAIVNESHYGVNKGKGGSTLKDSNSLADAAHNSFTDFGIDYVIEPSENVKLEIIQPLVIGQTSNKPWYVVHGHYIVDFYLNGMKVYSMKQFGSFDGENSSHAAHGALTCARTDMLFTILKAATKSEEDLNKDRNNASNRQAPRTGATPVSGTPY